MIVKTRRIHYLIMSDLGPLYDTLNTIEVCFGFAELIIFTILFAVLIATLWCKVQRIRKKVRSQNNSDPSERQDRRPEIELRQSAQNSEI